MLATAYSCLTWLGLTSAVCLGHCSLVLNTCNITMATHLANHPVTWCGSSPNCMQTDQCFGRWCSTELASSSSIRITQRRIWAHKPPHDWNHDGFWWDCSRKISVGFLRHDHMHMHNIHLHAYHGSLCFSWLKLQWKRPTERRQRNVTSTENTIGGLITQLKCKVATPARNEASTSNWVNKSS